MSGNFIDTNVFVYLFDERDQRKTAIADALVRDCLLAEDGVISFQIVQESLRVFTEKLPTPVSLQHTRRFLAEVLLPLWRVMPSEELYRRALDIQERYRYGFYDALIIAAALSAGCRTLYSEDFQHGQRIERLTMVNPFLG